MRTFDYAFPLLLMLSVLRQVHGKHLTVFQLVWPVGLVVWAAVTYLRGFPPTATDVALVAGCAVIGAVLGVLAGRYTAVYQRGDGTLIARAGAATVALWTLGTIGRLIFGLYAEHGGGPAIAAFSAAHHIAVRAWGPALILMALAEVFGRTLVLAPRALKDRHNNRGHPEPKWSSAGAVSGSHPPAVTSLRSGRKRHE